MKLFALLITSFCFSLLADYQTISVKGIEDLVVEVSEGGTKFTSPMKESKTQVTSYAWRVLNSEDGQGNAISFEYKGDGTPYLASVFLGANKYLLDAHEASFSLDSKEWKTITIPLTEFAINTKPWGVKKMGLDRLDLSRDKISHVGFGRGFQYHRFNHPSYSFTIRNLKFVDVKKDKNSIIPKGISKFAKKLKSGNAKVLLLGDSITEMGKEQSHFVHAINDLNKNAEVANAAIGGHSCRGGQIVLQRSLKKMPKPDLVYIMYGANDCKAITPTSGFDDKVFEQQLESLIKSVNTKTAGKSEFILVNGVPRIDPKTGLSKSFVEPLMPAYERLSKKYNLVLCDTMSVYKKLSREDQQKYYKDSVHQTQEGLKFMGSLIAQSLKEYM